MYEVLLPRVLSVTMFYHFAFMAVSLAMFGMTLGAVIVHLRPNRYTEASARDDLAVNAAAHAVALVLSFAVYVHIPFLEPSGLAAIAAVGATYVVLSVPFVFSGITAAIALTRFPRDVAPLYAADLLGAAMGCLAVFLALEWTTAPTAVVVAAALAALGAAAFARKSQRGSLSRGTLLLSAVLGLAAVLHHAASMAGHPILDLEQRTFASTRMDYSRWNAHSFVEVFPLTETSARQAGWGMSRRTPDAFHIRGHAIAIDEKAGTSIAEFHGDTKALEYLRYDVTNAAHQVRHDADVCVIGVGGGRDILSALYFQQHSVVGIELNDIEIDLLRNRYADFSGRLGENPKVHLVRDEARSYLARTNSRFDILQISLIDTFAATAAGAFTLAENSLYTVDAWQLFLERLKPAGVLTVSRYYFNQRPTEVYRALGLAVKALEREGISDPRKHIVVLKNQSASLVADTGIGTLLVFKSPLSDADAWALAKYAAEMEFDVALSPTHAEDAVLEKIANGKALDQFYATYPIDISPIDDDRPFFFQMLRVKDVLNPAAWDPRDVNWKNVRALLVLLALLVIVVVLTTLCVVVPLVASTKTAFSRRSVPMLFYFAAIGFGFMFIEMAQMQRLTIFLGHPSYTLSVVLFTLLSTSGIGSYLAGSLAPKLPSRSLVWLLALLVASLALVGLATPVVTRYFAGSSTPVRIAVAVGLLACMGLPMGMPFPLGMRRAAALETAPLAWYWGINGAASVCCSVIATLLSLSLGVTVTFWVGVATYALCLLAVVLLPGAFELSDSPASERRAVAPLVAGAAVLAFVLSSWRPHPHIDDAYISYRYARNLAGGNGLVFNIGERVEGITNLGWTLLVAAGIRLGFEAHRFGHFLAVSSGALVLVLTYVLAARSLSPKHRLLASVAPWLVLATTAFPVWATSGLETPLFAALTTLALIGEQRQSPLAVVTASVAATLVRPEGVLVAAVVFGALLLRDRTRRATWAALAVYAGALAALVGFRLWYYGVPLPNTFYVKVREWSFSWPARYLAAFFLRVVAPLLLPAVTAAVAVRSLRPAAAAIVAFVVYSFAVGGDAFEHSRFLVPVLPAFAALAVGGVAAEWNLPTFASRFSAASLPIAFLWYLLGPVAGVTAMALVAGLLLLPRLRARARWSALAGAVAVASGALAYRALPDRLTHSDGLAERLAFATRSAELERVRAGATFFDVLARMNADALRRLVPQPKFVVSHGLGLLGYYLPVRIIDTLGLVDPEVRHLRSDRVPNTLQIPGHQWSNVAHVLALRPDCVMAPGAIALPATAALFENPAFKSEYVLVPDAWAYCRRDLGRLQ
jgi:hypothetical protein